MLFYSDLQQFIANQRDRLERLEGANVPDVGIILDVLGPNEDQDMRTNLGGHSVTRQVERLAVDCRGITADRHRGLTRPSTGRESPLYKPAGARIVNRRQIFAVSPSECTLLSRRLDVEITAELLGANLVIGRRDGADYFISDVPLCTYFTVAGPDAAKPPDMPVATLIHYLRQKGCSRTGRAIAREYEDPSLTKRFVASATHPRGILCSVEYPVDEPAFLQRGQAVFFRFPAGACN